MKQEYIDILGIQSEEELDSVNWDNISKYQTLSEDFIREFKDYIDWDNISSHQKLSEDFIREFKDSVYWDNISYHQKLSEDFIREFKDSVYWEYISSKQQLSESFIRELKDYIDWDNISKYQTLSEDFIREFKDSVYWEYISLYQILSEDFIREFKDYLNWYYIAKCQKTSYDFINKFSDKLLKYKYDHNFKYLKNEEKMKIIKDSGLYEIVGDYILAYKSTKKGGYSVFNSKYKYEIGRVYESNCDCNIVNENSFGLSAWTEKHALNYYSKGELYRVKVHIDDVGAFIKKNGKLRCFKIEIIG